MHFSVLAPKILYLPDSMRRASYIALVCLLASNLLFNQVGLYFFHNKHDAHEVLKQETDQAQFHKHGDHCNVCALDTLFNLFFEPALELTPLQPQATHRVDYSTGVQLSSLRFSQNRAPPVRLS